jgi:hypothetical protein
LLHSLPDANSGTAGGTDQIYSFPYSFQFISPYGAMYREILTVTMYIEILTVTMYREILTAALHKIKLTK